MLLLPVSLYKTQKMVKQVKIDALPGREVRLPFYDLSAILVPADLSVFYAYSYRSFHQRLARRLVLFSVKSIMIHLPGRSQEEETYGENSRRNERRRG